MFQFQLFQLVFWQFHYAPILYITIYILVSYKDYKRGVCPSNFNWNNWNWNRLAVITILFYKASHREQFFSSLTTEVLKSETLGVLRTIKRRVQRTVVLKVHVDAFAKIDMWITHRHQHLFLLRVILDENEVILLVSNLFPAITSFFPP